jgi:hypothetical protein
MLISVRHHLGDLLRVDSAKRQLRDSPLQPNYLRGLQMVRYASTFKRALAEVHKSRDTDDRDQPGPGRLQTLVKRIV